MRYRSNVFLIISLLLLWPHDSLCCSKTRSLLEPVLPELTKYIEQNRYEPWYQRRHCKQSQTVLATVLGRSIADIVELHYNLLSFDTFAVAAATFPPFIAARMVDERLQSHFYCREHHKNKCQLPRWCHTAGRFVIGVPVAFFLAQLLVSKNDELCVSSEVYLLSLPFLVFGKDILKNLRLECCLRPWCEHFSCEKRSGGGFPSGHIAEAVFAATFLGLRFGAKAAVPLGMAAAFIAVAFINCNRHYLSQVIAGAGLGVAYALSANKIVDARLADNLRLGFALCDSKKYGMQLTYQF